MKVRAAHEWVRRKASESGDGAGWWFCWIHAQVNRRPVAKTAQLHSVCKMLLPPPSFWHFSKLLAPPIQKGTPCTSAPRIRPVPPRRPPRVAPNVARRGCRPRPSIGHSVGSKKIESCSFSSLSLFGLYKLIQRTHGLRKKLMRKPVAREGSGIAVT